jgi:hypothetical protein
VTKPSTTTSRRPRIGLSTYRDHVSWGPWAHEAAALPTTYVDCVAASGGLPLLLPPSGDAVLGYQSYAGHAGRHDRGRGRRGPRVRPSGIRSDHEACSPHSSAATSETVRPATERPVVDVPTARDVDAAVATRPRWPGCCAASPGSSRWPLNQLGPPDRRRPLGGGQRARPVRLLRGRARAADRPADPGARRDRHHLQGAARRRRGDRAVELPDADRRPGAWPPRSRRATRSSSSRPS